MPSFLRLQLDYTLNFCPQCGSENFEKTSQRSFCCADCDFEFFVNASAAVACFIVNERDEVLVVRRSREPMQGTLDLPGGFCDPDETVEQAVRREVKEETNLEVVQQEYLFSLPNRYHYSGLDIPTLDFFFRVRVKDVAQLCTADDAADGRWMPIRELEPTLFGLDSIRQGVERFLHTQL